MKDDGICVPLLSNDPDQMTISKQQMRNFNGKKEANQVSYESETRTRRL